MREQESKNFEVFLKGEFLTNAEDLVDKLESVLNALAEDLENTELVEEAFRYVHTLKGGAMTVGFSQYSSCAHLFEQTLLEIQEGTLKLDSNLVNHLLHASDFFYKMVEALKFDFSAELEDIPAILVKQEHVLRDDEADKSTGQHKKSAAQQSGGLVLVVEDNPEMAELTSEILRDQGLNVEISTDGSKAIEIYIKGLRPDLIITDLKMPKMSGLDLIRRFRDLESS